MATNTTTQLSRQPRGIVRLNGAAIEGWTSFEVNNNNYYSADTFRVVFVASLLPSDRDKAWFSEQTDMYVELFAGEPADPTSYSAAELKSWIYGQVDEISFDPVAGTIEVSGRDLTRVFIDAKTTQKWVNLTSSQIAAQLATSHGLTPVVTATTTKAGKFYEIDHSSMADSRSEWDILCFLAANEGFIVYVRGQSLYFGPPPDANTTPFQLIWVEDANGGSPSANFEQLMCTRTLTVSRGIQVVIRSWNAKQQKGFVAQYPAKAKTIQAGQSGIAGGVQIYSRIVPNLTQEQATQMAQKLYAQLVQHEMKISFEMPPDDALDTNSVIQLTGTGTAYDQLYYPDSITRAMSFDGGWTMHVTAKNHSPESEVQAT
ncbi:phage protein D [Herbaspirillum sp. Sphag1AN]|uniref:hypothetical protein n=1 Tax=unclassified Herbaspirillum TaxID=2624150 RepID=UPI00161C0AB4|nr:MULTISPECIES: hypothetical protein [unclassified Herbaspirillum]MBB3213419.1 phage protein D [Herbaspirillum sp. Sphag1AN]MBB3246537.1 phage protein D [Herbaspirillum sp. Sphag64]